jgi:DNA-binding transcriptional LysR family regulator
VDRLRALSAFRVVAELEGISAAARSLGVSKAVVSKYVTALEDELGVRLFHRSTRRMTLTAGGSAVLTQARQIAEQLETLHAVARRDRHEPSGTLRITAPATYGALHVTPRVAELRRQHPALRVELSLTDRFVRIAEEGYDVAIRVAAALPDQDTIAVKLATVHMGACASPAYLARAGTPRSPSDLTSHACLAYASADRVPWRFGKRGTEHTVWIEPAIRSDSSLALTDLALAGLGIALLPSFASVHHVRAGTLVELFVAADAEDRSVFAMYPSPLHLSAKVTAFVRLLKRGQR